MKQNYKFLSLLTISLLIANNVISSDNNNGIELSPQEHTHQPISTSDDLRNYLNLNRIQKASARSQAEIRTQIESAKAEDRCIANCCCGTTTFIILAALGFGFGFGYEPHTYRIWNGESEYINVHYRPGCTQKIGKTTTEVDCIVPVEPTKHLKLWTAGDLTLLCAAYTYGGLEEECTTYKGLKYYDWTVHGDLTFTRNPQSNTPTTPVNSTNTTSNVVSMPTFDFTATESEKIAKDIRTNKTYTQSYLRGSLN